MIRFISILGRTLPTVRIMAIADAMALSEDERYVLLERFAHNKTIDQCFKVSKRQQKGLVPILNQKVQLWFYDNLSTFFSSNEQKQLLKELEKLRKQRPDEFLF